MEKRIPTLLRFGLVTGLVFLLAGWIGSITSQAESNLPISSPQFPQKLSKDDSTACLACHGKPGQSVQLGSGEMLPITIDAAAYAASIHGESAIECAACHSTITGYPHPENSSETIREYALANKDTCKSCHADQYTKVQDSIHEKAMAEGDALAPTCADCHNPHTQSRLEDPQTGITLVEARVNIPVTCSRCHSDIYEAYKQSVHGKGVLIQGNTDTPTCVDCHNVHSIQDATSASFRLNSPAICSDCHTNPEIMDKYGLSTNVLSTYVADFHGTTVTIFEKTDPDQLTNKPVCFDCHGVHDIRAVDDPEKGIQVKTNMLKVCQKCHPDATENFPDSWMSHYIPSPEKAPLVFYINAFYYYFLIPVVLGGMAFYVITHIIRRAINRRKGAKHS